LVLGDTIYVAVHDTGDNPIRQGRVVAVDANGHLRTGFQFLGAGNTPGDGSLGGGVWNALATDGGSVYFTTGNTHYHGAFTRTFLPTVLLRMPTATW
jgi:hypothetical protein